MKLNPKFCNKVIESSTIILDASRWLYSAHRLLLTKIEIFKKLDEVNYVPKDGKGIKTWKKAGIFSASFHKPLQQNKQETHKTYQAYIFCFSTILSSVERSPSMLRRLQVDIIEVEVIKNYCFLKSNRMHKIIVATS